MPRYRNVARDKKDKFVTGVGLVRYGETVETDEQLNSVDLELEREVIREMIKPSKSRKGER
jgi:hypothetical protein